MSGPARSRYRKLPGRRRGFIRGASVWLGSDHLLLVRSMRFREEYRRFYFKDVQAIAVAKAPRFHVSTRILPLLLIAAAALPALAGFLRGMAGRVPVLSSVFWPVIALPVLILLGAWIVVSARFSCRCRIYTAVSGEELPSIYRTWTAKRFLAKVEPLIAQAQGTLDANWMEAMEGRAVGPVEAPRPASSAALAQPSAEAPAGPAAVLFALALLAAGIFNLATLSSHAPWTAVVPLWFAVAKIVAAVLILVQYNRGQMRRAVQRLAIAELIALGVMFYANQFGASMTAARAKGRTMTISTMYLSSSSLLRGLEGGVDVVLGVAAAALLLTGGRKS